MGLFRSKNIRKTSDVGVFGLGIESELNQRILLARATRAEKIEKFLSEADDERKREFSTALIELDRMLLRYASESERLLAFIDNNVIQDILKRDSINEPVRGSRFHALLALLMLAEEYYHFDLFACITPAVFYEAAWRGNRPYSEVYGELIDVMAEVGLAAHPVGFRGVKDLTQTFKEIRRDEREIRKALDKINAHSWQSDFSSGNNLGMRIPASLAEDLCPIVELQYFDPGVVKFLLVHVILKRMYAENGKNTAARKMMPHPKEKQFAILKTKGKDQVEGLADIELLSYCDLSEQTLNQRPQITVALTFDDGLRRSLKMRSVSRAQTSGIVGGDAGKSMAKRAAYMMYQSGKRTAKANRRAQEYVAAFAEFIKFFEKHFQNT